MEKQTFILQSSPRIDVFFDSEGFEISKNQKSILTKTKYGDIQQVNFEKGNIPWITGVITSVIDLITGHGVGYWKRGSGKLKIKLIDKNFEVELKNYDRRQTPQVVSMLNKVKNESNSM